MVNNIHEILEKYWGHKSFRPQQEHIINQILNGKDVVAILPTGGGKSVCFQVPAMAQEGICIVVSPLIALMQDQVERLLQMEIPALIIHTGMTYQMVQKILISATSGDFKFLYVSPERLETNLFQEYLPALPISFFAIDEAHCISQWGYDFRPPYLRIANTTSQKPNVPVIALTASATALVQQDIIDKLTLQNPEIFRQSFLRPNLHYYCIEPENKFTKLISLCKKIKESGIVYCYSRANTQQYTELLKQHNINADFYHAGLTNEERKFKLQQWLQNKIQIMVCTNAFGMGIDKSNVRIVVHTHVPDCLENYYQEAGRAGRDGEKSFAVLLHSKEDLKKLNDNLELKYPTEEVIKNVYIQLLDFLNVAVNDGGGTHYKFDIKLFCETYGLNPFLVYAVLQLLSFENLLSFNENAFTPSQCIYLADKELLSHFIAKMPRYENVLTGMLRLYGGLFEMVKVINERRIAKFLSLPIEYVNNQLQELNEYKIIAYEPANDDALLYLITNRQSIKQLPINFKRIADRKKLQKERIDQMGLYINLTTECRSVYIGNYFGDTHIKKCGVCDNCVKADAKKITPKNIETILAILKQQLNPISIITQKQIATKFGAYLFFEAIKILQDENKIGIDVMGEIVVKK
jgi:ATP-dependent DNA helicase RecQ